MFVLIFLRGRTLFRFAGVIVRSAIFSILPSVVEAALAAKAVAATTIVDKESLEATILGNIEVQRVEELRATKLRKMREKCRLVESIS